MSDNEALVAIFALAFVFSPVFMFFHWLTQREKRRAGQGGGDPAQMAALMDTAHRMERRIETLEALLDADVPGWRNRSNVR